jgi:hypothetical protein
VIRCSGKKWPVFCRLKILHVSLRTMLSQAVSAVMQSFWTNVDPRVARPTVAKKVALSASVLRVVASLLASPDLVAYCFLRLHCRHILDANASN